MRIAIIGAGVAGISTAIALKQKGFEVTIYERSDSMSHLGAGVVLWPNASYVLQQLGVLEELKLLSGAPISMRRLTDKGEDLGSIDITAINRAMGYPSLSILREDLMTELERKLSSLGVDIQYRHQITSISTDTAGHAIVHCQNNETITADVIIGADGRMASCARQYIHGDNKPIYQGFINWIGICEFQHKVFDDMIVDDYWGEGERFGIVPVSDHKAYWAGGIAADNISTNKPLDYCHELTGLFSHWPDIISQVIQQTPADSIHKIYVHDHNPTDVWHKNNLVMIGDAAHAPLPTSGQGACQALEDAWHLSNCLTNHSGNLHDVLAAFTQLRLAKTSQIIMTGRHLASSIFSIDPDMITNRNENSRKTDFASLAGAMSQGWSELLPL